MDDSDLPPVLAPENPPVPPRLDWNEMTEALHARVVRTVARMGARAAHKGQRVTPEDLEDITQESFFRAFRDWLTLGLREMKGVYRWLLLVARNLVRGLARSEWVRRRVDIDLDAVPEKWEDIDADLERLHRVLVLLEAEDQRILWLRLEDGMAWRAIGAELGCSKGAARKRFARVCSELRRLLRSFVD